MHLNHRHLVDAKRRIGIVVSLIDHAAGQGDFLGEDGTQTKADATFASGPRPDLG